MIKIVKLSNCNGGAIIDPEFDNEVAFRCYKGAGFVDVDEYIVKDGFFKGKKLHLMIRGREREKNVPPEER